MPLGHQVLTLFNTGCSDADSRAVLFSCFIAISCRRARSGPRHPDPSPCAVSGPPPSRKATPMSIRKGPARLPVASSAAKAGAAPAGPSLGQRRQSLRALGAGWRRSAASSQSVAAGPAADQGTLIHRRALFQVRHLPVRLRR